MASPSMDSDGPPTKLPSANNGGPAPKAREFTTTVLNFLSTASNETLGACIVGLGAVTYLILGRVGLVLIGAFGGVVLHAAWEGQNISSAQDAVAEQKRRKEVGLDIVRRLLDARDRTRICENGESDSKGDVEVMLFRQKELNFDDFQPATGAALTSLVDAVVRDYVKWWYSPILPDESSFPFASRQTLMAFMLAFSSHLSRKRPADTFLNFLTNSTSIFIVFLSELSHALMAPGMQDSTVQKAVGLYLEQKPDSSLASVLDRQQQEKKFKMVAEDVLQTFLDSKTYNCDPAKAFLREVLSGLILESVLKTCSKPEWINGWIVYLLEEGEPEIMNAIDAGVGGATGKQVTSTFASDALNSDSAKAEAAGTGSTAETKAAISHQRKVSKAEAAMEEAMLEAKRLSELIAEEEAKRPQQQPDDLTASVASIASTEPSAEQAATPTSSQSDGQAQSYEAQAPTVDSTDAAQGHTEPLATPPTAKAFTSFDQILPPIQASSAPVEPPPLTLHKAQVTIFDDAQSGDKSTIRSRPVIDYLLQIEPRTSHYPGWMTARKFADFETLHEVLRRIAPISGVPEFTKRYTALPVWKNKTKSEFTMNLEAYLQFALSFEPLAESEGMKRFLEKEQQLGRPTPTKGVLGFPSPETFSTMGKGMLDVIASAPKGAAGGGKAILGGVTGVFGAQKKSSTSPLPRSSNRPETGVNQPSGGPSRTASTSSFQPRPSQDSYTRSPNPSMDSLRPPLPTRRSVDTSEQAAEQPYALGVLSENRGDVFGSQNSSIVDVSRPDSQSSVPNPISDHELEARLPPPPSEIPDDYNSITTSSKDKMSINALISVTKSSDSPTKSLSSSPAPQSSSAPKQEDTTSIIRATEEHKSVLKVKPKPSAAAPLDEQETQVAIELIFAVISELYTLSSAWNIRRTLLNAAKTFLLRPGNPQLEAIRVLLQDTVIEANTSDAGLAAHLLKLRENSLPTEEELVAWPPPMGEEEAEKLRLKARKLLAQKGMPQALTSVMGQAASGEALGRVFDSLQVEEVARGLMFALLLQGVRAMTH